jgi:hypothetical protein
MPAREFAIKHQSTTMQGTSASHVQIVSTGHSLWILLKRFA